MANISYYPTIKNIKSDKTIPFDIFLDYIRDGKWQDIVLPIRAMATKEERTEAKKKAPYVTISGTFSERTDSALTSHSGYIGIDIDDVEDPNHLKSILCPDKYLVAAFTSISGRGLCLIFKITPTKHREAFQGICEYLYNNYGVIADPTSINVSRPRFVSYDPFIFTRDDAEKFTHYPKTKPPKRIEKTIFAQTDFEEIIQQVVSRRLNMCENYHEWLRMGFALAHQFSEAGRSYYHLISQFSAKYDSHRCDKQYTACLKAGGHNQVTIATFYYYCKQAGVQTYSERTRKIAYTASNGKRSGLSASTIADNLKKFEDISGADVPGIVKQVIENDIELHGEDSLIDQLELWLRQNYDLKRNCITRYIEQNGKPLMQADFNSIYLKAKKVYEKVTFELIDRLINSDFISDYNPFIEYIEHQSPVQTGHIEQLFASINTPDPAYLQHFGKKWLVSIIASIHGEHSPLMPVLSGELQGTGKTEFFRRLLPNALRSYYAESKLDAGKDDEILMTQKLIIMDDEMGGKSKKESKRLKELTSKQTFSLREPYGRNNVDLNRIAVLCGTTNDNEILNDPTGNRRIIPVHVDGIDHGAYNSVNKDAVFMEAYQLWKAGFEWRLSREDIAYLGKDSKSFEVTSLEAELIAKYLMPGTYEYMTASDVKVFIEDYSRQKLLLDKIGKELKRLGFQQEIRRYGLSFKRVYGVEKITTDQEQKTDDNDLPF